MVVILRSLLIYRFLCSELIVGLVHRLTILGLTLLICHRLLRFLRQNLVNKNIVNTLTC